MKYQSNKANYLQRLQASIDYIEGNLTSTIDIQHAANQATMSRWHFQRMFRAMTGDTVKSYIRTRRLSNALEALLSTNITIIDIALSAGFETQESFTRAFSKNFGITPGKFRELGESHQFMRRIRFDQIYLQHLQNNLIKEPVIKTFPSAHYLGINTQYYGIDSDKNNLGDKLQVLWDNFLLRMNEIDTEEQGVGYGIIHQAKQDSDLLNYLAAVKVRTTKTMPENMSTFSLPESLYAVFQHTGNPALLDNTVNYIYSTWLPQSSYQHSEQADIEIYGEEYIPNNESSVIYYAIPLA